MVFSSPFFFIMVGANFDLNALLESPEMLLLVPVILALAYAVKILAALVFRTGFDWRHSIAAGTLLSSRLSLIIAVAAIGLDLGGIDEATNAAIILVAIVTSTLSPLLFNRILPATPVVRRKFVVVGAGKQPRLLARRIAGHEEQVVVIDCNPEREAAVQELGLDFILADATDRQVWVDLSPDTIQAVAAMLPSDDANLQVCDLARQEFGVNRVVARMQDATRVKDFADLGVGVVNPSLSPVVEMEYMLLYPSVSSLLGDLNDEHEVAEVRLRCSDLTSRPLRDVRLPEGAMVVLIRRDGDIIYPRGNTQLRIGDRLTLMGPIDGVRELARQCE